MFAKHVPHNINPARLGCNGIPSRPTVLHHYTFGVLCAVALVNYVDRQIISVLLEAIKRDFGASDAQMGMISGLAFAVVYTIAGIFLARLADVGRRVPLIAASLALWSGMTIVCGFAKNYIWLVLGRMGVAAGEAGFGPAAQSIIGDLYPPHRRATAFGVLTASQCLGIGVGIFAGGWISDHLGWRAAFMTVGAPGAILALVLVLTVPEPKRERQEVQPADAVPPWPAILKELLHNPRVRLIALGTGFTNFTGMGVLTWSPALLIRAYGMSTSDCGLWIGLSVGTALVLGSLTAGFLADLLGKSSEAWYGRISAIAALLVVPCLLAMICAQKPETFLLLFFAFNLTVAFINPPVLGLLMSVVRPEMRGTAYFLTIFSQNVIGVGFGPLFIGLTSDALSARYGAQGLAFGIAASSLGVFIASLCYYRVARHSQAQSLRSP